MKSGIKIRNKAVVFSTVISVFFQNFFTEYQDNVLEQLKFNNSLGSFCFNIIVYLLLFILSLLLCKLFLKITWVRVHVFKEKIVEGKWFECIYLDSEMRRLYSYGIVDTFFDDNGDFVYKGFDYSLNDFTEIGEFCSTCSSLKYDNYDDRARLDYAYEFRHNNQVDQGYGCINFTVNSKGSNKHNGKFFNSDGVTYYFFAILITDKKILKLLSSGRQSDFYRAMNYLKSLYESDFVSQRDKIAALYELSPETFEQFSVKEDYNKNILKVIKTIDFRDKIVLDMGAGTGRMSEYIVEDVKHLICSDSSKKMLTYLKQKELFCKHKNKIKYIHCDHMALPVFLEDFKNKIDVIMAGYTIGAYFNDELISSKQKTQLLKEILTMLESMMSEGGTLIIIETLGIEDAEGKISLLKHDSVLEEYYDALAANGFEKTEIDTSFKFDNENEAYSTVNAFWGAEAVTRITEKNNAWFLKEMSGVWIKTKQSSLPVSSNNE